MLWVEPHQVLYSDSYGAPPEDKILELINHQTLYFNKKQIQGYDESHCGIWALQTALAIYKGYLKDKSINNDPYDIIAANNKKYRVLSNKKNNVINEFSKFINSYKQV
jgi:hypothetical protein